MFDDGFLDLRRAKAREHPHQQNNRQRHCGEQRANVNAKTARARRTLHEANADRSEEVDRTAGNARQRSDKSKFGKTETNDADGVHRAAHVTVHNENENVNQRNDGKELEQEAKAVSKRRVDDRAAERREDNCRPEPRREQKAEKLSEQQRQVIADNPKVPEVLLAAPVHECVSRIEVAGVERHERQTQAGGDERNRKGQRDWARIDKTAKDLRVSKRDDNANKKRSDEFGHKFGKRASHSIPVDAVTFISHARLSRRTVHRRTGFHWSRTRGRAENAAF